MGDILERLQGPRTPQGGSWPYPNLHDEAADEITRLRELLDDVWAQWDGDWPEELVARVKAVTQERKSN